MCSPAYRQIIIRIGLILSCWSCSLVRAQEFRPYALGDPQPVFRNISAANGLPSSETYDIHEDRKGYIWIATDRGVVRYDGFRYQTFTRKDGLADDVIFKLVEDPKGRIWFVSFNGLLSFCENGRIRPYRYNDRLKQFFGSIIPTYKNLVVDEHDRIYYGVYSMGGITISASGKTRLLHDKRRRITARKYGNRWLAICNSGLKRFGEPIIYKVGALEDHDYNFIDTCQLHYTVNICYAGSRAFMQIDNNVYDIAHRRRLFQLQHAIGLDCLEDQLFVGLFKNGVRLEDLRLPERHPERTRYLLQKYSVTSVMRDREGGYWFTTLEKGVFYTPDLSVRNYTAASGLSHLEYSAITGFGKDIYIADLLGCTKMTPPTMRILFDRFKKRAALGVSKHKVYMNRDMGGIVASGDNRYVYTPIDFFGFFGEERSVLAAGSGISRFTDDGKIERLYHQHKLRPGSRPPQNYFHTVAKTAAGRIYAGNLNGLFEIKDLDAEWLVSRDPLFGYRVIDLEVHPVFNMVVATRGRGVYCFDEHQRITRTFTRKDGLLSDQVDCLYTDQEGNLYVGTSHGLTIFRLENGKLKHRNLTTRQGLCSNEINSIYRMNDQLWVGTKAGVSVIDLRKQNTRPRGGIALSYLSLDGRIVGRKAFPARLPSDVGVVKMTIRTMNFSGVGTHRFAYRLRHDGEWFNSNDPEVILNEPRSDDYEISVKFLNDRGVWSKPVRMIRFTVAKPFYLQWYSLLLFSVVVLLLAFWIFRIILRRVQQRHQYQTTISQLEQKALRAQMNPHFIFNSLNSIQSFLIYEENEKAERYLLKFAQLIRQTLNNSRESYITIEAEMDTLRRYLELEQMRFKDKFDFAITCNLPPSELLYGVPPMLIQPFVENAVLHGFQSVESGGKIDVVIVSLENNRLLCIVEDNGVGRKATEKRQPENHKSFGTKITTERLAAFRQKYGDKFAVETIDKEENGRFSGTKVLLRIPVVSPAEVIPLEE